MNVGDRVKLTTVRHTEFVGLTGVVKRVYKTRRGIDVKLDDGRLYEAYPENVEVCEVQS